MSDEKTLLEQQRALNLIAQYRKNVDCYTEEVTGRPALDRIAKGEKACWKKLGVKGVPVKKALIISDWSLQLQILNGTLIDFLKSLFQHGFPLFCCVNGKLVEIVRERELYDAVLNITPIHSSQVTECVETYNRQVDEYNLRHPSAQKKPRIGPFEILDFARLREVVKQHHKLKGVSEETYDFDSFKNFTNLSPEQFQEAVRSFDGTNPFTVLYHEKRSPLGYPPTEDIDPEKQNRLEILLKKRGAQIQEVQSLKEDKTLLATLKENSERLRNLENLRIDESYSSQILELLPQCSTLKNLAITSTTFTLPEKFRTLPPLPQVTQLELDCMQSQELEADFFKIFPQLETLRITNYHALKVFESTQLVLPHLKHLSLAEIMAVRPKFTTLCPQLEVLELLKYVDIGPLKKLRKFSCKRINIKELIQVLNECQNLEEIEVDGTFDHDDDIYDEGQESILNTLKKHPKLKKIVLNYNTLRLKSLAVLTHQCPHLEVLEIKSFVSLSDPTIQLDQLPPSLPLKKLIVEYSACDSLNLLLAHYKEVEQVQIDCNQEKSITGIDSSLLKHKLMHLFTKIKQPLSFLSPALEELTLASAGITVDEKPEKNSRFLHLKKLTVQKGKENYTTPDLEQIATLCHLSPNLTELRFDQLNDQISHDAVEKFPLMPQLEKFTCKKCDFYEHGKEFDCITNFIKKCPHLKSLQFENCKFKKHEFQRLVQQLQRLGTLTYNQIEFEPIDYYSVITVSLNVNLKPSHCLSIVATRLLSQENAEFLFQDGIDESIAKNYEELVLESSTSSSYLTIDDKAALILLSKLPYLHTITLRSVDYSQEPLRLFLCYPKSRELRFENCIKLNVKEIIRITPDCAKTLSFIRCPEITPQDIALLQAGLPRTKINYIPHEKITLLPSDSPSPAPGEIKSTESFVPQQQDTCRPRSYNPSQRDLPSHYKVKDFYLADENQFPPPERYRTQIIVDYKITADGFDLLPPTPEQLDIKPYAINLQKNLKGIYDTKHSNNRYHKTDHEEQCCCYGQDQFDLTTEWSVIPGFSPNDELIGLEASLPFPFIEVGFSKFTQQYFVRLAKGVAGPQSVNLAVIMRGKWETKAAIEAKPPATISLSLNEHQRVQAETKEAITVDELIAFCQQKPFTAAMLAINPQFTLLTALSEVLCTTGACEDRTTLFLLLAKHFNFEFLISTNCVHSVVEVMDQGKWRTVDLGGVFVPTEREHAKVTSIGQQALPESIYNLLPKKGYTKELKLSDTAKQDAKQYCTEVLDNLQRHENKRNLLLEFDSADQILRFKAAMTSHLLENGGDYHYLADFNQFSKTDIKAGEEKDNCIASGIVQFLQNKKPNRILFVDWSDYQCEHLGFNTIMDDYRHIKGEPIPDDVIVISLLQKSKGKNLREDFHSRFRYIDQIPNTLPLHSDIYQGRCSVEDKSAQESKDKETKDEVSILPVAKLYNDEEHWQEDLLGKVHLTGRTVRVEEGPLIKALLSGQKQIILAKAPWHCKSFQVFLSDALQKGEFTYYGTTYKIPKDFRVLRSDPVLTSPSKIRVEPLNDSNKNKWDYVVNDYFFDYFFTTFRVESGSFYTQPGWLDMHPKDKEMVILITSPLSKEQRERLEDRVAELKLNVLFLDGQRAAPDTLTRPIPAGHTSAHPLTQVGEGHLEVVHTKDSDFTLERLKEHTKIDRVICVGPKTTFCDLIDSIVIKQHDKEQRYSAEQSYVIEKLLKDETIVIKGPLSAELRQGLETLFADKPYLWINGKKFPVDKGRLIILSEEKNLYNFSGKQLQDTFTEKEVWDHLAKEFSAELCEQVKLDCEHNKIHPDYQQLRLLLNAAQNKIPVPEIKGDQIDQRTAELAALLQHKNTRSVFIYGETGTGKSHTVFEDLPEYFKDHLKTEIDLYPGLSSLKRWALAPLDGKIKLLVVDEANLEDDDFDILEGLLSPNKEHRGIARDGRFYPLSDEHRIVFAGNFKHYIGRIQQRIFNHSTPVEFKPLTQETLLNRTEILLRKALPTDFVEIPLVSQIFMTIYNTINEQLETTATSPLTLRNLQAMALRFAVFWQRYRDIFNKDITQIATMAAYEELRYLFSKDTKKLIKPKVLEKLPHYKTYKAQLNAATCDQPRKDSSFLITKKRRTPFRLLVDQMAIRELRAAKNLNLYGVSGVLLEGPYGTGKSSLAEESLKGLQYQDVTADVRKAINLPTLVTPELKSEITVASGSQESTPSAAHKYVRITTADPEELKNILIYCFHKGYVVIIDELNLLPCENILNHLMSGRDLEGNKAQHPGFFVIATQNPCTTPGRQELSPALKNRFEEYPIPEYSDKELHEFEPKISANSIRGYQLSLLAAQEGRGIKPTVRDLTREPERFSEIASPAA